MSDDWRFASPDPLGPLPPYSGGAPEKEPEPPRRCPECGELWPWAHICAHPEPTEPRRCIRVVLHDGAHVFGYREWTFPAVVGTCLSPEPGPQSAGEPERATYHPTAVAVTLTRLIREHLRNCLRTIRGVDCPDLLHIVDEWAQKIALGAAPSAPEGSRAIEIIREISQFETFEGFYWSWSPAEREAFDRVFGRAALGGGEAETKEGR